MSAKEKKEVDLEKEIKRLKAELKKKQEEVDEYIDKLKRLAADFENFKKRMLKEQTKVVELAAEDVIKEILPIMDNLERALVSAQESRSLKKLAKGVEMVYAQLKEALRKKGLEEIEPSGEVFDPEKHEAVLQEESDKHDDNVITEVLQKGYLLKGKVIRPAMVKVAKNTREEEKQG